MIRYALLRLRCSLLTALLLLSGAGTPLARGQVLIGEGDAAVELAGSEFVASLGSTPEQVRWAGSGGFAKMIGETKVTLNDMEWLIWGKGGFVPDGRELVFGRADAGGTVNWNSRIDLGGSNKKLPRRIRLVRGRAGERANVTLQLRDAFRSTVYEQSKPNWRLEFVGDGRFDILAEQPHLRHGDIHIFRAELRLADAGQLRHVHKFELSQGATFVVDERSEELDRLGGKAELKLNAGVFRYLGGGGVLANASEHLGNVLLLGGVNTIDVLNYGEGRSSLFLKSLSRGGSSESPRGVFEMHTKGQFVLSSEQFNPDFEAYGGILPWATINDSDWVARSGKDWVQINSYYAAGESSWEPGHNVTVQGSQLLSADRCINSLRSKGGSLNLGGHTLILGSGALAAVGADFSFGSTDASGDYYRPSIITTDKTRRPLYAHIHAEHLWVQATFTGGMDLVKAGRGALHLMHGYGGELGDVYIHQGRIELAPRANGFLKTGAIYVGDGSRSAVLKLVGRERLSSRPHIILRGSIHTRSDAGVLELSGATQQSFSGLHVENAAVIDCVEGATDAENVLCLDALTFNSETARLTVRHWVKNEDRILVKRSGNLSARGISQIEFEGWGNARLIDYDKDYWEIVSGPDTSIEAGAEAFGAAALVPYNSGASAYASPYEAPSQPSYGPAYQESPALPEPTLYPSVSFPAEPSSYPAADELSAPTHYPYVEELPELSAPSTSFAPSNGSAVEEVERLTRLIEETLNTP